MSEVLTDRDAAREWLGTHVYDPSPDDPEQGAVGLEVEFLPFWRARSGAPAARLALVEMVAVLDEVAERDPESGDGRPSWHRDGVLITEEPGAQLELAGPPDSDAGTALARLEGLLDELVDAFRSAGAVLVSAGLDVWSDPDDIPVQLEIPRYEAMSAYFEARGGRHGHLLMCASGSIQVNLDLGPPAVARRRWDVANLAAPVLTAAFAASPRGEAANGRAMGWRRLDPTRTGVSPPFVADEGGALHHVLADVLRADVMMVARDGTWRPGAPGWRFGDWLERGHPEHGPPTTADLRNHLTTLFPEARLRGFIEIRPVDALPRRFRTAAVTLVTGLFYDSDALAAADEALATIRPDLPALLERAARAGLGDDTIAASADVVLEAALAGARRLGLPGTGAAEAFLDRFSRRRRAPGDELREALEVGPSAALRWAEEDAGSI